ncbi:MAG: efflux RND transporter periplasmic adaptor subunit [Gallionella sp.]|nr:efflux RND transporter periplasmic adaptor subunit [Gallionella sp.]
MALEFGDSRRGWWIKGGAALMVVAGVVVWMRSSGDAPSATQPMPVVAQPALTVTLTAMRAAEWARSLSANGSVVAWQEAIIGAETNGVRIVDVRANVGDQVKKGQVLASLAVDSAQASEAEAQAMLKESEAMLAEAAANAERMRKLRDVGFVSAQMADQSINNEKAARARVDAQQARHQASAVRLHQSLILAPDAGVISARSATVGTLTQPGMELFRLIRQGKLEWHAELSAAELAAVREGMSVELLAPQGERVLGKVRAVAPAVDPKTRYGQVLVTLPPAPGVVAGMFARGTIQLDQQAKSVWSLPQSAVMLRDGGAYVFIVDDKSQVHERKVLIGQRHGEQIEIVSGLEQAARVVESGGAFLVEGDVVRVAGSAK